MAAEKPSMKIPENGKWSTEAQNKVRDNTKAGIQKYAQEVVKDADPTKVLWKVGEGETLGAIAFAFNKAYKNLGKDLKINWGTTVEFTRDGKTETLKLAQVNPKNHILYPSDAVKIKFDKDGNTVITVNEDASAPVAHTPKPAPEKEPEKTVIEVPVKPVDKASVEMKEPNTIEVETKKVDKAAVEEKK